MNAFRFAVGTLPQQPSRPSRPGLIAAAPSFPFDPSIISRYLLDESDLSEQEEVAIYTYWLSKQRADGLTYRQDVDPTDLASLLPHMFIIGVDDKGAFRFRLMGTHLSDVYGLELTGKTLASCQLSPESVSVIEATYRITMEEGTPALLTGDWRDLQRPWVRFRALHLPLCRPDGSAGYIVGTTTYRSGKDRI